MEGFWAKVLERLAKEVEATLAADLQNEEAIAEEGYWFEQCLAWTLNSTIIGLALIYFFKAQYLTLLRIFLAKYFPGSFKFQVYFR